MKTLILPFILTCMSTSTALSIPAKFDTSPACIKSDKLSDSQKESKSALVAFIGGVFGWNIADAMHIRYFYSLMEKHKNNPERVKELMALAKTYDAGAFIPQRAAFKCVGAGIAAFTACKIYNLAKKSRL
jgi:hypothetical protein